VSWRVNQLKESMLASRLKSNVPDFLIVLFWYLVFLPGRMSVDSASTLEVIQQGESTSTQTAIYFRYLQIFSFNGERYYFISLINIVTFYFASRFFCLKMFDSQPKKVLFFRIFLVSPFFGFFGGLIQHELQFVSGCLILLALLKRDKFSGSIPTVTPRLLGIACIGVILANCRWDGIVVTLMFVFLCVPKKTLLKTAIAITFLFIVFNQSALLKVEKMPPAFKFASLIGDIKCISSDPLVELSTGDLDFLKQLAGNNYDKLFEPTACNFADHGFFVFETFQYSDVEFMKGYLRIALKNPMLILNAHIERSRQVLPPILFRSPPNMFDFENDESQFPANTRPGILYTMRPAQTNSFIQDLQGALQSALNLPAYLINQRSNIWGWGGLWIFTILVLNWISSPLISREQILIILSHLGFLFLTIPTIDARYLFMEIFLGILIIPHQLNALGRKIRMI
jgi:hypothetical protein